MKNFLFFLSVSLFIASCGPTTVIQSDSYQPAPAPVEDVSYQSFYDQLAPYGTWINYPGYGYVWMPQAGPDFQPYATNGNWIYTDAGWTWASNYNWGWAPFHYGRWFYENGYGWMWVPGNEWAPAWVSWRGGGDYYGWAPMGPGVSVDIALSSYNPPSNYWNFVPRQYMGNPNWHNYYVGGNRNVTIINNTTIINNYSGTNRNRYAYAPGPDPNEVRRYSGNQFTQVQIREANAPGERMSGSQYVIYHPRVSATPAARGGTPGRPSTPAPARYESFNNVRPSAQYQNNQPNNTPPANNTRSQNSGYNQPAYNQPANPRPQNQNYNPPVNNQPNLNPPPANNPRQGNPGYNQPSNSQPVNNPPVNNQPANPRPQNQNYNQPPANNQPAYHPQPVQSNPAATNHINDVRANQFNQTPAASQHPVTTSPMPKPSPANHVQTTGRPSSDHNPNNGQPVQRTPAPQNKPADKPEEKPKTREANNG